MAHMDRISMGDMYSQLRALTKQGSEGMPSFVKVWKAAGAASKLGRHASNQLS